jgi:outer membrane protein
MSPYLFRSAKGADTRRETVKEFACPWRSALDTVPVLREFLGSSHKIGRAAAFALIIVSLAPASRLSAQEIAPAKVAIINVQMAVSETAEIKKAVAELQTKFSPRQKTIEALQKELQDIQKQGATPNIQPQQEASLQAQFTTKQKQLQRLSEDLQTDVNAERQDILGRTGRQMAVVVKKLAEERGLDVVIDVTNLLYFKPALDITPVATAAYDKAYPVK